ncbi:MAG: hypothetical protein HC818_03005 [Synechococcaceae cyanobacterium RM1_1_27]|nr:hypothetical protein [Synechococcaceae cyanobacterium RM1_1_27]
MNLTAPWLHQHSDLGILPLSILADLIPLAHVQPISAEQVLVAEGEVPEGLVILLEGKLGAQGSRAVGSSFCQERYCFCRNCWPTSLWIALIKLCVRDPWP